MLSLSSRTVPPLFPNLGPCASPLEYFGICGAWSMTRVTPGSELDIFGNDGLASLARRCRKSPYVYTEPSIHSRDVLELYRWHHRHRNIGPSGSVATSGLPPTTLPRDLWVSFRSAKDSRRVTNTTKRASHQIQASWLVRSKAMLQNLLT